MAKYAAKDGEIKIGANAIANIRNWTFTDSPDVIDATVMGDTHKDQFVGLGTVTGSFSCFIDPADTTGQGAIDTASTLPSVEIHPTGDSSGNVYWDFTNFRCSEIGRNGDVGGMVEINFGFVAESYTESTTP